MRRTGDWKLTYHDWKPPFSRPEKPDRMPASDRRQRQDVPIGRHLFRELTHARIEHFQVQIDPLGQTDGATILDTARGLSGCSDASTAQGRFRQILDDCDRSQSADSLSPTFSCWSICTPGFQRTRSLTSAASSIPNHAIYEKHTGPNALHEFADALTGLRSQLISKSTSRIRLCPWLTPPDFQNCVFRMERFRPATRIF